MSRISKNPTKQISDELKEHVLNEWSYHINDALEDVKNYSNINSVTVFVLIDGVMDKVVYNVKTGRFESIFVKIAKSGIGGNALGRNAVYCDEYETVEIPIPIDLQPQRRKKHKWDSNSSDIASKSPNDYIGKYF